MIKQLLLAEVGLFSPGDGELREAGGGVVRPTEHQVPALSQHNL